MDSTIDALSVALEKLVPTSLDEVIRAHRDTCRLAIASQRELDELAATIPDEYVRHTLKDWQIITLSVQAEGQTVTTSRLTGVVASTGESWITSHIMGVDLPNGLVETANSAYRVVGGPADERDLDYPFICAALNSWGIGQYLDVPEFFF